MAWEPVWKAKTVLRVLNKQEGPPELVQPLYSIGGFHIGARAILDMAWLYCSPISVGRRGVISLFKWFLPAFPRVEEGGGSASCGAVLSRVRVRNFFYPSLEHKITLWLRPTCLPSEPKLIARAVCSWVWAGIMPTSGSPAIGSARAGRPFIRPGFEPPFYKTEFHTGRFWISSRKSTKKVYIFILKIEWNKFSPWLAS